MINDFSVLPTEVREGRVGPYWYHEDTQAFFDDVDHYKMIKAMCKLSCSECDKMDEQSNDGPKRRGRIRNLGHLKNHLYHQHRLWMCSLCLEGRKVKSIILRLDIYHICTFQAALSLYYPLCLLRYYQFYLIFYSIYLLMLCRCLYVNKSYIREHN